MDIAKLRDFAFLFTVLAGEVQLTSLIFQTSLNMYAAGKRCIMRLLANFSAPYGKLLKAKAGRTSWKAPGRCGTWWSNVRTGKAPDSK